MRVSRIVLSAALIVGTSLSGASAAGIPNNTPPPLPLTFSDGAVATPTDHCGDADLCATISYPNGDNLFIYSEGAAYCQPYMLHFVRVHGNSTLFEYSRTINHDAPKSSPFGGTTCGNSQAT